MHLQRLYPAPLDEVALAGCFLKLGLQHGDGDAPLLYANFISSLDGRIAVADRHGNMQVPAAIANPRDWRLYQELAAQSGVMITSARYFRQLAAGRAQALLPVDGADLQQWRQDRGMLPQPDLFILSHSLDIPLPALAPFAERRIAVLTIAGADAARWQRLESAGVEVVTVEAVTGQTLRQAMRARDYRSGYVIAGCGVLHTLLADGALDRLFLTTHHTLLGGERYDTLLRDTLPEAVRLELRSLFLDEETGQQFAQYTIRRGK